MKKRLKIQVNFFTNIEIDVKDDTENINELIKTELDKGYVCENLHYLVIKEEDIEE